MTRRSPALAQAFAALVALAGGALPLAAQDYTWVETRFHRVHLRNGNVIDGKVLGVTEQDVHMMLQAGEMTIRSNTIDRIELVKMRSLLEKPKLDPPLKKVPPRATVGAPESRTKRDLGPADASDELKSNVAAILGRLKIAKASQKDDLIDDLARQPQAAAYLASLLPSLDEEPCYMVRTALMRMKDREAGPYLVAALDSDRPFVQINALILLGVLGDGKNAPPVRPFLLNSPPAIRATAIETLQQLNDRESQSLIADLIGDEDDMVRFAAITASLELGRTLNQMEVTSDRIRRSLTGSKGRIAKELLVAAARSGRAELWAPVAEFLRDPDPLLRRTAAESLQGLAASESAPFVIDRFRVEDDSRTLIELAKAAAKLKSKAAVADLIELLQRRDANVVRAAAQALESITKERFGESHAKWSAWRERNQSK